MRTLLVSENGALRTDLDESALDRVLSQPHTVTWLDISNPVEEDVALLRHEFKFHPLAIEDAVRSPERPKVDAYGAYYFVVFYAARYNPAEDRWTSGRLTSLSGPTTWSPSMRPRSKRSPIPWHAGRRRTARWGTK